VGRGKCFSYNKKTEITSDFQKQISNMVLLPPSLRYGPFSLFQPPKLAALGSGIVCRMWLCPPGPDKVCWVGAALTLKNHAPLSLSSDSQKA